MSREFKEITFVIGMFGLLGMLGTIADLSRGKINIVCLGLLTMSCIAFYLSLR